ncbi:MAG: hypothetical protein WCF60_12575 [Anaerobacillus sp.]
MEEDRLLGATDSFEEKINQRSEKFREFSDFRHEKKEKQKER